MINENLFRATRILARKLARQLELHDTKIVFAESCTAGLVSGILAQVPGISKSLCGSAVTYREPVKHHWLNIDEQMLEQFTAVSAEVTQRMAESVLQRTPDADFSVSITGHLDSGATPDSPVIFVGLGYRSENCVMTNDPAKISLHARNRIDRQWESAKHALTTAVDFLEHPPAKNPTAIDWERVCFDPVSFRWNPWS